MRGPILEEDIDRILADARLSWDRLEDKAVLITGANGFLPAYMVHTLLRRNERSGRLRTHVMALVRNAQKAARRFAAYQGREDLQLVVQDATAPPQINRHVDFIVHAASQASPKYFGPDPVGTLLPNVVGTRRLLDLARDHRVESFLYFSSSEVYGRLGEDQIPTTEDFFGVLDPTDVRSCYAESKRMGETMCVCWRHQHGVSSKIVRPFHTYGPGMDLDDGRVFADLTADVVRGRDLSIHGDGLARRTFCYLADATLAFFTVLLEGEPGEAYNVGNDQSEISVRELAETLVSLFPEKRLKVVLNGTPRDKGYLRSTVSRSRPDVSKIRALGWAPTTSIEEGFQRTIRSYL